MRPSFAVRYTLTQSDRHGLCADYREYMRTHTNVALEDGLQRARKESLLDWRAVCAISKHTRRLI